MQLEQGREAFRRAVDHVPREAGGVDLVRVDAEDTVADVDGAGNRHRGRAQPDGSTAAVAAVAGP